MREFIQFIDYVVVLYTYVVIASVILSWLIGFNVINGHNPIVRSIWQAVTALTEPLLKPIRRVLPNMGGLDLSPVILLLGCLFIRMVVLGNLAKLV